jgi:nitroreductase
VDACLAVASKRDQREYAERPVPEEAVRRNLDAGRIAGGAKNRQPWRFPVLGDRGLVDQVAHTVYASPDLLGAPRVIANCGQRQGPVAFDAGRAAQNVMLAAWNEASSPVRTESRTRRVAELLGLKADEQGYGRVLVGYPARARDPEARPSEECPTTSSRWIAQTGDEVHTYERLCGRKLDVDQLELLSREVYELSSQINAPTTWARSTGCAATRGG